MTDTVLTAITQLLTDHGISASREYADTAAGLTGARVYVGIESCKLLSPGCGDYLGTKTSGGTKLERYGYRCEMTVLLDVFAPHARDCIACFDDIGAALAALPQSIKYRALVCGETVYDEVTGLFHAPCRFMCQAMLERSYDAQNVSFADFTLKGVLRDYGEQ